MEQVYYCLVFEHDYRLVLVAAAICLFGSATTFVMVDRAREARHRAKWLALLALCSGATVWSTHFVAMLAFEQGLTMSYALYATLGSLLAGIVGIGGGFAIALPRAGREWTVIAAGLVAGTGVIVLHYVGMSAVRLPGRITYDADLVIASVAFSLLFGGLSFYFAFARNDRRNRALALTCFVLMVVLLHFTAMGAVRIEPGPWLGVATPELSRETLATLVAATTIALLAVGLAGALFDRRHSHELFALAQRFRVLSDSALEGLVIHRGGAVLDSNAAARRLLALDGGPEPELIYSWFGGAPRAQVGQWLAQTADAPAEVALAGRDGRTFTAEVCGSTLQLPDGSPGQVLAIRDVTARKEAEARLEHQALHDPLTDLPNRRLFVELADKVRAQAARHGGRFAVFMLDLDNFKTVNDLHGHGGGDRLLVELARRIQADLRDSDIVARFGGDEFALVATAPEQPQEFDRARRAPAPQHLPARPPGRQRGRGLPLRRHRALSGRRAVHRGAGAQRRHRDVRRQERRQGHVQVLRARHEPRARGAPRDGKGPAPGDRRRAPDRGLPAGDPRPHPRHGGVRGAGALGRRDTRPGARPRTSFPSPRRPA